MNVERDAAEHELLASLRAHRAELVDLLARHSDHWNFEDPIYRFYHQSFKVFRLQAQTESIVVTLGRLVPGRPLNDWFKGIVARGTGRTFSTEDNRRWVDATAPIVEAFFHARYLLEMAVRYSDLDLPPRPLPSGYAALLYLYNLR